MRRFRGALLVFVVVAALVPGLGSATPRVPQYAAPNPCGKKCRSTLLFAGRLPEKRPCDYVCLDKNELKNAVQTNCYEGADPCYTSDPNDDDTCYGNSGTSGRKTKYLYGHPNTHTYYEFGWYISYCDDGTWQIVVMGWIGQGAYGQSDDVGGVLYNDRGQPIVSFEWGNQCCTKPTRNGMYYIGELVSPVMHASQYGYPHDFFAAVKTVWPGETVEYGTNVANWKSEQIHME